MKIKLLGLSIISVSLLSGCVSPSDPKVGSRNTNITFTNEYGAGGTRLPGRPELLVDPGLSTASEVFDLFGQPQIVQSFPWGKVVTYRYWENKIGSARYEEYVEFVFNQNGFLDEVISYANSNSTPTKTGKEAIMEREEQCPSHYKICQSYDIITY
ncbi:hypothetical protein F7Q91_02990 [Vibrio chagasii]|uniref:Lipoprotein SmpA/OmlA domain-containing protein n=1 Tax=Vibrio chagasii TaxID=170679 RepID=A0A7V7NWV5_9VIBR|nr:hypothetical protein [Vibrio chagasii]KAB0482387.1 hypothetical protein F7Q91_02990 [Vibrio chagasii]